MTIVTVFRRAPLPVIGVCGVVFDSRLARLVGRSRRQPDLPATV
jgi:hypothetical protein